MDRERDNNYVVYCHKNKINGKRYIGKAKDYKARWGANGSGYTYLVGHKGRNTYFGNAILKYGWDNFEHCILESGLSSAEASEREKYYIELFKTNIRKYGDSYGYNMTDGGDGAPGRFVSDESRAKMSESHKGKTVSDETRRKISLSSKGREPLPLERRVEIGEKISAKLQGRKLSPEHVEHIRAASIRRGVSDYTLQCSMEKCMKYVKCVDTGEVFRCMADASSAYNVSRSCISACCTGKKRHAKGLRWEHASDQDIALFQLGESVVLSDAERMAVADAARSKMIESSRKDQHEKCYKRVLCVELDKVFDSVTDAALAVGTDKRNISQCVTGRSKTCLGYHWRYVDDKGI